MTEPAQTLEIIEVGIAEIARPTHTLILADRSFMSTLAAAEKEGAGLSIIKDAVGAQAAASLQGRVTKAETLLNKSRLDLIRPYQNLIDSINAAAKEPKARLQTLKEALSKAQTMFNLEQARLAREAEVKRLQELQRLENLRLAEEKAAKEKAEQIAEQLRQQQEAAAKIAESARLAGLPITPVLVVEDWGDDLPAEAPQKTETEKQIEAIKFAPAPVIQKASGVREVVTLYPRVVDIELVPSMFVTKTIKLAALQSTFCRSWKEGDKMPECPGVAFDVQRSTVSTGRAGF